MVAPLPACLEFISCERVAAYCAHGCPGGHGARQAVSLRQRAHLAPGYRTRWVGRDHSSCESEATTCNVYVGSVETSGFRSALAMEGSVMRMDWRAVVVASLLVPLVGMTTLPVMSQGFECSQHEMPAALRAPGERGATDWHTYRNGEHGFQIEYPPDFDMAADANVLVASGAVITFVPAFAPSIDGSGGKTNLIAFSVTIGVTDTRGAPSPEGASCLADTPEHGLDRRLDAGGIRFAKRYFSEGAVGNRYEKLSYLTDCGDRRYEIALFVHSGSPWCYASGAITIFDPVEITDLFETMVGTFRPTR